MSSHPCSSGHVTILKRQAYAFSLFIAMLFISSPCVHSATGPTTYCFVGVPFNQCGIPPDSVACHGFLTGSFTVAQPLPPNLMQGIGGSGDFLPSLFSFTDGTTTFSNNNVALQLGSTVGFSVDTDAQGNLTQWSAYMQNASGLLFIYYGGPQNLTQEGINSGMIYQSYFMGQGPGGTWSRSSGTGGCRTSTPLTIKLTPLQPVSPAIIACGSLPASQPTIPITATFVDSATQQQIAGGTLVYSLNEEVGTGGHPHSGRPLGTLNSSSGPSPLNAIYSPGEASGVIDLTVTGTAPDGAAVTPSVAKIHIETPGFRPLNGITFNILSHPQGTYGIQAMQIAVSDMAAQYNSYTALFGDINAPPLRSEAASLPLGGVFDINHTWKPPHCGHRNGKTIDLSLSNTTPFERAVMQLAAQDAGIGFYYIPESPSSTTTNHWHGTLQ
jgi:hypothetical protein